MSWLSNDTPPGDDTSGEVARPVSTTPAPPRTEVRGQAKASVWIQPHPRETGKWQVKREGASRASRVFDTQQEAEQFGRQLAQKEKVELKVAGREGQIRQSDSFGNDPRNIPG
jgi:hypothetical protein